MTERLKFLIIYAAGVGLAIAAFFVGGIAGFAILGFISALLFEGAKTPELLGWNKDDDHRKLIEERERRSSLWHRAILFLDRGRSDSLNNNNSIEMEIERNSFRTALAILHDENMIDTYFAAKAIAFPHVSMDDSEFQRLRGIFVLSIYKEDRWVSPAWVNIPDNLRFNNIELRGIFGKR